MSGALAVGDGTIGGGGLTYTYTTFELTAAIGDGTIDAPDIDISLSAQTMFPAVGGGTIGASEPTMRFSAWSAEVVVGSGTIGTGITQMRDLVRSLFPALSPSTRSFTPPEYALSKYKTVNGDKSRRLWASQPGGGTLDLEFENIGDDDAEDILAAHDIAKGATNDVILPDEVLSGAEGDLLAYMRLPGGQAWSFNGPPELESVKEGMSTVRVKLTGRRKLQFNSVGSVGSTFAVGASPVDEIDPISFADCDFIGRPPDDGGLGYQYYRFTRMQTLRHFTDNFNETLVLSELQLRDVNDAILSGTYTTNMAGAGGSVGFWNDSNVTPASAAALATPFDAGDLGYVQFAAAFAVVVTGFRQACTESLDKQLKTFRFWGTSSIASLSLPTSTANGWVIIQPLVTMPNLPAIETLSATTVLLD